MKLIKQSCRIKIDLLHKIITEPTKILVSESTKKRESERRKMNKIHGNNLKHANVHTLKKKAKGWE